MKIGLLAIRAIGKIMSIMHNKKEKETCFLVENQLFKHCIFYAVADASTCTQYELFHQYHTLRNINTFYSI